jgi:hypothetical protein
VPGDGAGVWEPGPTNVQTGLSPSSPKDTMAKPYALSQAARGEPGRAQASTKTLHAHANRYMIDGKLNDRMDLWLSHFHTATRLSQWVSIVKCNPCRAHIFELVSGNL